MAAGISISIFGGPNDEIKTLCDSVDKLVRQKDARTVVLDEHGQAKVLLARAATPSQFANGLAEVLVLPKPRLEKLLKRHHAISGITLARIVAARRNVPFEKVYRERSTEHWLKELQGDNIPLEEVRASLEKLYTEAAVISLDAQTNPLAVFPATPQHAVVVIP